MKNLETCDQVYVIISEVVNPTGVYRVTLVPRGRYAIRNWLLDYYDSEAEADKIATYFQSCYKVAIDEGLSLHVNPDVGLYFSDSNGMEVAVANALFPRKIPAEQFRLLIRDVRESSLAAGV